MTISLIRSVSIYSNYLASACKISCLGNTSSSINTTDKVGVNFAGAENASELGFGKSDHLAKSGFAKSTAIMGVANYETTPQSSNSTTPPNYSNNSTILHFTNATYNNTLAGRNNLTVNSTSNQSLALLTDHPASAERGNGDSNARHNNNDNNDKSHSSHASSGNDGHDHKSRGDSNHKKESGDNHQNKDKHHAGDNQDKGSGSGDNSGSGQTG
ncbi:MAG: hypothetical protein ABJB85_10985 [Nitrososphaerota archaeon]